MKSAERSVSQRRLHVTAHAVRRYVERVEMGDPSASIGPEYDRVVDKILSVIRDGRKMSTEECALFVRAAGRVASGAIRGPVPANWGDYYYDEATNAIVVVSAEDCDKVVTVMVPSDMQLQTLEQIATRSKPTMPVAVSGALVVNVLASLPRTPCSFEIVILDDTHPSLSLYLRRPDSSGREVIRYVEAALHTPTVHTVEDASTITIDPLLVFVLVFDNKLLFRDWSQSFRSRDTSLQRFEFFVRPTVAPFLVRGLLGNDMIDIDREHLKHGAILLLRTRAKGARAINVFHLDKF